jgi:hypothetical protein
MAGSLNKVQLIGNVGRDPELARQLIEEGRTREVLSGFRSRAGKPFRARLVLNSEGKVEFDFPTPARQAEPAAAE